MCQYHLKKCSACLHCHDNSCLWTMFLSIMVKQHPPQSTAHQSDGCRLKITSIRWAFVKWTFLSQPFPPSIYHYVNKCVSSETFTFEHIFAQLIPVLGALSLPWWCGLCRGEVVRAPELIPATVFVFRTKGKFQQPPWAWYLDYVLECILDKVFLFDRFVLRNFT